MKKLILLFVLFSQAASATIWITLADPRTNKIAIVGASSGDIGDYRTMVSVDNYGLAAIGSWYLGRNQTNLKALMKDERLTAREVAVEFNRLINLDSKKRRVSFVNARFETASVPGRGCHSHNHFCGKIEADQFTVTGGGLVGENVLIAAKDALENSSTLPIECQLYRGIKAIFESGGEIKRIKRLSFMIDDVTKDGDVQHKLFKRGNEAALISDFRAHLLSMGFSCE